MTVSDSRTVLGRLGVDGCRFAGLPIIADKHTLLSKSIDLYLNESTKLKKQNKPLKQTDML